MPSRPPHKTPGHDRLEPQTRSSQARVSERGNRASSIAGEASLAAGRSPLTYPVAARCRLYPDGDAGLKNLWSVAYQGEPIRRTSTGRPHRTSVSDHKHGDCADLVAGMCCPVVLVQPDGRCLRLNLEPRWSMSLVDANYQRLTPRALRRRVRNSASPSCLNPRLRPKNEADYKGNNANHDEEQEHSGGSGGGSGMSVVGDPLEYMQREQSDDKQGDPSPRRQEPSNQESDQDPDPERVASARRPHYRGLLACSR